MFGGRCQGMCPMCESTIAVSLPPNNCLKTEGNMSQTIIPALEEATIGQLREAVRGQIFTPATDGYSEASRIWNGAHDGRRPALVIRCTGAADVIAAVGFARSNDLSIAVRGGGHSIAGFSTGDDVVVIDLSPMNSVRVDTTARWATVGGGAVWADVDHETLAHGLATTGGLVSSTGVAGFTLGGGIGWLMRKYGLAGDNLVGADVVTADGRVVHASHSENRELFWGIRGGGGNFGIVTQFEFELHPIGDAIYAGPIFYSADADGDLLRRFRDWAPSASDDVTAIVNLTSAPPLPVIPEEWHGRKVAAFLAASAGPVEEGEGHVGEFRTVAEPVADLLGPMPYQVIQTLIDPLWQTGIHAYFKATNLARLDDQLIERLSELHHQAPGPQCEIHVHQMGGAVGRVPDGDTAFAERSAPYVLNAVTGWHDPELADAHIDWARAVIEAAADASTGRAYVNFLGDAGAGRSSYGEHTYSRLVALKNEYDPANVFARNQNIEPAAGS
jgi:FAD/FMN-containing dehydrogenase